MVRYSLTHKVISVSWEIHLRRYNELTTTIGGIQIRRSCQHILPFMLSTIDHFLGKRFLLMSHKKIIRYHKILRIKLNNKNIHNILRSRAQFVAYSPVRQNTLCTFHCCQNHTFMRKTIKPLNMQIHMETC